MSPTCIVSTHSSICLRLGMSFPWQQSLHIQCLIHSHDLFIRNVLTSNSDIYNTQNIIVSNICCFPLALSEQIQQVLVYMTGYVVVSMTTIVVSNSHDLCMRNDLHWCIAEFIKFTYYNGATL